MMNKKQQIKDLYKKIDRLAALYPAGLFSPKVHYTAKGFFDRIDILKGKKG